jgi:hypothetical protein
MAFLLMVSDQSCEEMTGQPPSNLYSRLEYNECELITLPINSTAIDFNLLDHSIAPYIQYANVQCFRQHLLGVSTKWRHAMSIFRSLFSMLIRCIRRINILGFRHFRQRFVKVDHGCL